MVGQVDSPEQEVYYRYELEETIKESLGSLFGKQVQVLVCKELKVFKRTPKGAWVGRRYYSHHSHVVFCLDHAKKRWAHPTKKEELDSMIARKTRQIKILEPQLADAKEALRLALLLKEETLKEVV